MNTEREATPEEWAARLLAGKKLTQEELAASLRAAIRRGWFSAVHAAALAVTDDASKLTIRDMYNWVVPR